MDPDYISRIHKLQEDTLMGAALAHKALLLAFSPKIACRKSVPGRYVGFLSFFLLPSTNVAGGTCVQEAAVSGNEISSTCYFFGSEKKKKRKSKRKVAKRDLHHVYVVT